MVATREKPRTVTLESGTKVRRASCSNCGGVVEYRYRHKPTHCPHCGDGFWNKPADEATLHRLQKRFVESGRKDTSILGEMYPTLLAYTKRIVLKVAGSQFTLEEEDLEERCHVVLFKLMRYYLEKPDFTIQHSFGRYIEFMVPDALWGRLAKMDDHDSLNYHLEGDRTELVDMLGPGSFVWWGKKEENVEQDVINQNESLIDEMMKIVYGAHSRVTTSFGRGEALALLLGMHHSLKLREPALESYYGVTGSRVRKHVERLRVMLMQYLKDIQSGKVRSNGQNI